MEQTLESYELCCLVETFPHNHASLEEFCDTLKYAYIYAKTVTLGPTHWPETNRVTLRNRRIGCSMSGLAQFIESRGIGELHKWCEQGYRAIQEADVENSDWLAIPRSIKTTSIKPSGTVSLVAGGSFDSSDSTALILYDFIPFNQFDSLQSFVFIILCFFVDIFFFL